MQKWATEAKLLNSSAFAHLTPQFSALNLWCHDTRSWWSTPLIPQTRRTFALHWMPWEWVGATAFCLVTSLRLYLPSSLTSRLLCVLQDLAQSVNEVKRDNEIIRQITTFQLSIENMVRSRLQWGPCVCWWSSSPHPSTLHPSRLSRWRSSAGPRSTGSWRSAARRRSPNRTGVLLLLVLLQAAVASCVLWRGQLVFPLIVQSVLRRSSIAVLLLLAPALSVCWVWRVQKIYLEYKKLIKCK